MVWTAPMTAVAGDIFKASQFNTHVRDNLLETALGVPIPPATDGYFYVTTGANSLSASTPRVAFINTSETTASTTYTDLATVGPTLTDLTVNAKALVSFGARLSNSAGTAARMSVEWSNDSGVVGAASDTRAVANSASNPFQIGSHFVIDLVPGTYTFTCKYRVVSGTGTFLYRNLFIFPF